MHTEKREDPLTDLGYEVRDINMGAIVKTTIGFFVFAALSGIGGWFVYAWMNPGLHTKEAAYSSRHIPQAPYPVLQNNFTTRTDISVLRQQEMAIMHGGVSQQPDGSYRIPINAAMQMIADNAQGTIPNAAPSAPKKPGQPGLEVEIAP